MSRDELAVMDGEKCILQLRGVRPFLSNKYDIKRIILVEISKLFVPFVLCDVIFVATIRSREISASIILQSQSQLKTIYKDAAETITGNCDTVLFLGGKESSTLKEISETLGKETIDLYNTSDTRGSNRSYGLNYQKTGKELMSRDQWFPFPGFLIFLSVWSFPFRPGKERCHSYL